MRNGLRRRRLPRIRQRRFRKTVPWLSMCSSERPLVSPSAHAPNPTAQPASTPVHRISSVALSDSVQRIQRNQQGVVSHRRRQPPRQRKPSPPLHQTNQAQPRRLAPQENLSRQACGASKDQAADKEHCCRARRTRKTKPRHKGETQERGGQRAPVRTGVEPPEGHRHSERPEPARAHRHPGTEGAVGQRQRLDDDHPAQRCEGGVVGDQVRHRARRRHDL